MAGREEELNRISPESREEDAWSFPVPDEITDDMLGDGEDDAVEIPPLSPEELEEVTAEAEFFDTAEDMEKALEQEGIKVDTPLRIYIREVCECPLLTAEEENALARRMAEGDKEAGDRLIEANLRLVLSVARRFANRGVPLGDLIQEGSLGLMQAAEKFDGRKGYRFSTYAVWWIRRAVSRAVADQSRVVRLPLHVVESIYRVTKSRRDLTAEYGRDPTVDEIAADTGMTEDKVEEVMRIAADPDLFEKPETAEEAPQPGEDEPAGDGARDENALRLLQERVRAALDTLDPEDAAVVRMRFGLEDGRAHTADEVARAFGIPRERVRQIEAEVFSGSGR